MTETSISETSSENNAIKTFGYYLNMVEEEIRRDDPPTDNDKHKLRQFKRISEDVRNIPIHELTPEKISSFVEPWRRGDYGVNGMYVIMAIIRQATKKAYNEQATPINVGKMVKVKVNQVSISNITEEIYDGIQDAILSVPGGRLFGLAAHLNTSMLTLSKLTFEDCYEEDHIIHFTQNGCEKTVTLVDPDGIEIFQTAVREYQNRMSDPAIASTNTRHLLFCTKYGQPYEDEHCNVIRDLLAECTEFYELSTSALPSAFSILSAI